MPKNENKKILGRPQVYFEMLMLPVPLSAVSWQHTSYYQPSYFRSWSVVEVPSYSWSLLEVSSCSSAPPLVSLPEKKIILLVTATIGVVVVEPNVDGSKKKLQCLFMITCRLHKLN